MKQAAPPVWIERLLEMLLPEKDRATVAGDLYEEFRDNKAPQLGRVRANAWYLRQVASFAPRRVASLFNRPIVLAWLCVFTAMCGGWLGAMDVLLHHPAAQIGIAGCIVSQALVTLAALRFREWPLLRYVSLLGCIALFWLVVKVVLGLVHGNEFEGYIVIIAAALLVQAILTLTTTPHTPSPPSPDL